jgi:flagellar protein FliS
MTNDPARAYRQLSVQSASPIGLIVLLFNSAIASLHKAERAAEANRIEERVNELNHVLDIVSELRSVLDFERGGDVARQFDHFYQMAEAQILQANLQNSPEIVRDLISHFVKIRDAWQQMDGKGSEAAKPAAASGPAPSPEAAGAANAFQPPDAPRSSGRWSA